MPMNEEQFFQKISQHTGFVFSESELREIFIEDTRCVYLSVDADPANLDKAAKTLAPLFYQDGVVFDCLVANDPQKKLVQLWHIPKAGEKEAYSYIRGTEIRIHLPNNWDYDRKVEFCLSVWRACQHADVKVGGVSTPPGCLAIPVRDAARQESHLPTPFSVALPEMEEELSLLSPAAGGLPPLDAASESAKHKYNDTSSASVSSGQTKPSSLPMIAFTLADLVAHKIDTFDFGVMRKLEKMRRMRIKNDEDFLAQEQEILASELSAIQLKTELNTCRYLDGMERNFAELQRLATAFNALERNCDASRRGLLQLMQQTSEWIQEDCLPSEDLNLVAFLITLCVLKDALELGRKNKLIDTADAELRSVVQQAIDDIQHVEVKTISVNDLNSLEYKLWAIKDVFKRADDLQHDFALAEQHDFAFPEEPKALDKLKTVAQAIPIDLREAMEAAVKAITAQITTTAEQLPAAVERLNTQAKAWCNAAELVSEQIQACNSNLHEINGLIDRRPKAMQVFLVALRKFCTAQQALAGERREEIFYRRLSTEEISSRIGPSAAGEICGRLTASERCREVKIVDQRSDTPPSEDVQSVLRAEFYARQKFATKIVESEYGDMVLAALENNGQVAPTTSTGIDPRFSEASARIADVCRVEAIEADRLLLSTLEALHTRYVTYDQQAYTILCDAQDLLPGDMSASSADASSTASSSVKHLQKVKRRNGLRRMIERACSVEANVANFFLDRAYERWHQANPKPVNVKFDVLHTDLEESRYMLVQELRKIIASVAEEEPLPTLLKSFTQCLSAIQTASKLSVVKNQLRTATDVLKTFKENCPTSIAASASFLALEQAFGELLRACEALSGNQVTKASRWPKVSPRHAAASSEDANAPVAADQIPANVVTSASAVLRLAEAYEMHRLIGEMAAKFSGQTMTLGTQKKTGQILEYAGFSQKEMEDTIAAHPKVAEQFPFPLLFQCATVMEMLRNERRYGGEIREPWGSDLTQDEGVGDLARRWPCIVEHWLLIEPRAGRGAAQTFGDIRMALRRLERSIFGMRVFAPGDSPEQVEAKINRWCGLSVKKDPQQRRVAEACAAESIKILQTTIAEFAARNSLDKKSAQAIATLQEFTQFATQVKLPPIAHLAELVKMAGDIRKQSPLAPDLQVFLEHEVAAIPLSVQDVPHDALRVNRADIDILLALYRGEEVQVPADYPLDQETVSLCKSRRSPKTDAWFTALNDFLQETELTDPTYLQGPSLYRLLLVLHRHANASQRSSNAVGPVYECVRMLLVSAAKAAGTDSQDAQVIAEALVLRRDQESPFAVTYRNLQQTMKPSATSAEDVPELEHLAVEETGAGSSSGGNVPSPADRGVSKPSRPASPHGDEYMTWEDVELEQMPPARAATVLDAPPAVTHTVPVRRGRAATVSGALRTAETADASASAAAAVVLVELPPRPVPGAEPAQPPATGTQPPVTPASAGRLSFLGGFRKRSATTTPSSTPSTPSTPAPSGTPDSQAPVTPASSTGQPAGILLTPGADGRTTRKKTAGMNISWFSPAPASGDPSSEHPASPPPLSPAGSEGPTTPEGSPSEHRDDGTSAVNLLQTAASYVRMPGA